MMTRRSNMGRGGSPSTGRFDSEFGLVSSGLGGRKSPWFKAALVR